MSARIGILGGTFDPVHAGHVRTAQAAREALGLARVLLMPSRVPAHRAAPPHASRYHRFAMAALAVQEVPALEVSDLELCGTGPTFTSDTLSRLAERGLTRSQIFFITGADAFAEIATWHRYPAVLDMAHFVVVARPGHPPAGLRDRLPALSARMREAGPPDGDDDHPVIHLVNAATPDVSSSEIRDRLRSGGSIAGLVPAAVEAHIRRHRLYSTRAPESTLITTADHLHGQD